ncbi:hypothetical protein JW905_05275, partial [bacterium]|nr:hypothetical protein [candidate division CSSED10-310 bacterium]
MKKSYWMVMVAIMALATTVSAGELDDGFRSPPDSARPWVYWFWMNGNITKQGIKADLEAMQRVGIGGVLIMEVGTSGFPAGTVAFAGPEWNELFTYACAEAKRLGLKINMTNMAGCTSSGGPWIPPELSMQTLVWTETKVDGAKRIEQILPQPEAKQGYYRDVAVLAFPTPAGSFRIDQIVSKAAWSGGYHIAQNVPMPAVWPAAPSDSVIPQKNIVDLTRHVDQDGKLTWDAPAGQWTLLRMGHTSNGCNNHVAPGTGVGLECDKLNKEAVHAHFQGFLAKLLDRNREFAGADKTLISTHIDSWEQWAQNWTPRMREEFQKRCGYDPLLLLPVMTGQVVDNLEVSERFLWDLRQTISDLFIETYAVGMRELANRHGIRLSLEGYGPPCNNMAYAGQADEPMGEFWMQNGDTRFWCAEAASAAHVYGRSILGAEAFTGLQEKWLYHPGSIFVKITGDWAFCQGVNRFVFHQYAMQPWLDGTPGMSVWGTGMHYVRTQTWWEQSKPWHEYVTRCQYLLRQGLFVADICFLCPEGTRGVNSPRIRGQSRYNHDDCPPEALLSRMSVKDGRLVLPDGMSYRILVLPPVETMTPQLLRGIKKLTEAGATVIGPKPRKSPSLSDYPDCDAEVEKLTAELWDGGKIVEETTPEATLRRLGVKPDFESDWPLMYHHRRVGETDDYFLANGPAFWDLQRLSLNDGQQFYHAANSGISSCDALCSFRVTGGQPELWEPTTGRIRPLTDFEEVNGCTRMSLHFEPGESVFVVFRRGRVPASRRVVGVMRNGKELYHAGAGGLVNGGFEEGTKGWQVADGSSPTLCTASADTGKTCLQIVPNQTVKSEALSVQPLTMYRLAMRVCKPAGSALNVGLLRNDQPFQFLADSNERPEFEECVYEFITGKNETKTQIILSASGYNPKDGSIRVDTVRLVPERWLEPLAADDRELLNTVDFEKSEVGTTVSGRGEPGKFAIFHGPGATNQV